MLGKPTNQDQLDFFKASFSQLLNPNHPLFKLANLIPWKQLEKDFAYLYPQKGAPSHPFRKMAGLLFLQYMYNLSDERVVELWKENPYFQFFCGEATMQWEQPCAASDLVHLRKRIGEEGMKSLFAFSVQLHGKEVSKAKEVLVDTTVQEKNITYPTDAKLYKKIIDKCNSLSQKIGIKLRQSYRFVSQKLMYVQRYARHNKKAQEGKKAISRLKTLAGRQVRDLARQVKVLGKEETYASVLSLMLRILSQKQRDKDKIYSLHTPEVSCIGKGKAHKKYEFGAKVSLGTLPGSNVIVGVLNFRGNPHDGKTLSKTLEMVASSSRKEFKRVVVDKGYRGHGLKEVEVVLPGRKQGKTVYERRKEKSSSRRRSALEALIGHLKRDHKLGRNYLKGVLGDGMNALLGSIGFNLRLLLRKLGGPMYHFFVLLVNLFKREEKSPTIIFTHKALLNS